MKLAISTLLILTAVICNIQAQDFGKQYLDGVKVADSLFKISQFRQSGELFNKTFRDNSDWGYLPDRYIAASAWSMAGEPDSTFFHLFRIVERGKFDDISKVETDSAFKKIHSDPRWLKVVQMVRANKDAKEAFYNWKLISILDTIFASDQKYRSEVQPVSKKFGRDSPEMTLLFRVMDENDSLNIITVSGILDQYGWPGPEIIADHGSTLFLVLQHADLSTRQKYLPLFKEAVTRGAAEASDLAFLEDRIAIQQGRCQIYGSQIRYHEKSGKYYIVPLADPENVDDRRSKVGLESLAEYISHWKIKWDKNEYRKEIIRLLGKKERNNFDCLRK